MSRTWYFARVLATAAAIIAVLPALATAQPAAARPSDAQTPAALRPSAKDAQTATPSRPKDGQAATAARPAPKEGEVQSDPIKCWWKADRTAVRVGERFGLVLTCAVIEAGPITVVPVLNQLEPGALSITPFEVVSGARGDDMVAPPWRYVQFDYAVRLLSDGFFGQDVMIPGVTVTYNLQTAGGTQGRDQTYVLPSLPMRILSLVPKGVADIRDASGQTFASIESRRFRSSLASVLAWVSFAFAGVLGIFALVRVVGHFRSKSTVAIRRLPVPAVLSGCLDTISEVSADASKTGWSPDLARRAVAAMRIAGAVALERPIAQDFVGADAVERDGQVTVRKGWIKRRRVLLSASVTSKVIASHLGNGRRLRPNARVRLETISDALGVFSAASYGRNGKPDASALDAAVDSSRDAIRGLRSSARWPMRTAGAMLRSFTIGG
jgi:hypothetical protein